MRKQLLIPSLVSVLLVAMLAGLIVWRLDNSVARGRWVEAVELAPAQIMDAKAAVEAARETLSTAESVDFTRNRYEKVQMVAEETVALIAEFEPILEFIEAAPEVDEGPLASTVDPLSLGNKMEPSGEVVVVPRDFQNQLAHFTEVGSRLQFSTSRLAAATANLEDGLANLTEIRAKQKIWKEQRDDLKKTLDAVKPVVTEVSGLLSVDEGSPLLVVNQLIEASEKLLDETKEMPDELDVLGTQAETFKDAQKQLKDAETAVIEAAERAAQEAAELQLQAELEAQRLAQEQWLQQQEQETYVPPTVPPAGGGDTNTGGGEDPNPGDENSGLTDPPAEGGTDDGAPAEPEQEVG